MFIKLKQQKNKKTILHNNQYSSFDDFINMMLTCSEVQFDSTVSWFKDMRKNNININ